MIQRQSASVRSAMRPNGPDARVVDDDVDGAEALHRGVGEGLDAAAVAAVGLDGERAEVVGGTVQRRHLDVADHQLRAGRASRRAMPSPMPEAPPVTTATLPSRSAIPACALPGRVEPR